MSPRVSVVVPAFDAQETIGATVSSILGQSYRDFEVVVVDDGSTDATAEIVSAHRGPIVLVHQENAGVAVARNRGIAESSGELVTFCDADDMLLEKHLEALVATFDAHPGRLATANSYWLLPGGIHPSKRRYKGRFPRPDEQRLAILQQNFVSTMSIFPRTLPEEIGFFDERKRRAEDWDFWLRAIFAGRRFVLQRRPLALYRWSASSLSADRAAMDAEIEAVLADVETRFALTESERAYLVRRHSGPGPRQLARSGDAALREGRYGEAARRYREAAALVPSERMLVWKARVLSVAPRIAGPAIRARQVRIERRLAIDEGHER